MPLFRMNEDRFDPIPMTTFAAEGIRERADLQRLLRDCPEVLEDGLVIIAEEFGSWEDSNRRIDLLAIDREHTLVVVELKRADETGFMELQAVRYAAMVANMTFDQLLDAHREYLRRRRIESDPAEELMRLLGYEMGDEPAIDSARPRVLLVSGDFSRELTTSVLWLNDAGLDIRCVRVRPYRINEGIVVDVEQVLPLPEASDYLVRVRQKAEETDTIGRTRRERTVLTLIREGIILPGTEIVIDRRHLTADVADLDDPTFHAHFAEQLDIRNNVKWDHDGNLYSLSGLTEKLRNDGEVPLPGGALNGYWHWCLASQPAKSLYELAEEAGRRSNG